MANRVTRVLKSLVVRVYALAILLAVVWTGYAAVSYLVKVVFRPAEVPAEYLAWQADVRVDPHADQDAGEEAIQLTRAPVRHYHGVPPDAPNPVRNNCTTSGCHGPLPHTQNKGVRAFANMHTTFLTCGMCHAAEMPKTLDATWTNPATGDEANTPAVLRLLAMLDEQAEAMGSNPEQAHAAIMPLLAEVVTPEESKPVLAHLRLAMNTSQPGSPVWRHAVDQLCDELPHHVRGDYGMVISPTAKALRITLTGDDMQQLTEQYLAAASGSTTRESLSKRIHQHVQAQPAGCRACHNTEESRIDFASLGYTAQQVERFGGVAIANLMERIQAGEPFYLPRTRGGDE